MTVATPNGRRRDPVIVLVVNAISSPHLFDYYFAYLSLTCPAINTHSTSLSDSSVNSPFMMSWCLMSSDVSWHIRDKCDQCRSTVRLIFTSTETRRLVRTDSPGRPPRLSHSSWTLTVLSLYKHVLCSLPVYDHHPRSTPSLHPHPTNLLCVHL